MRQIQDYIGFQVLQVHKAHRSRAEAALNKLGIHTGQEMLLLQLWIEEGMVNWQFHAADAHIKLKRLYPIQQPDLSASWMRRVITWPG